MAPARGVIGQPAAAPIAVALWCLLLAGAQSVAHAAPADVVGTAAQHAVASDAAAAQPTTATDTPAAAPQPVAAPATAARPPAAPGAPAGALGVTGQPTAEPSAGPDARGEAPAITDSSEALVQQPRPFGYVLGDTLTQHILLGRAGNGFQPAALPPTERAGLWFARRSSKIQRFDDDSRWLVIEYQVVNAPQTLTTVNLPAVSLKSNTGQVLTVAEWPISVAPLTPRAAFAKGGLQEMRPDHPAPMLPTSTLRRQLEIWVSALALTLVVWLGWWSVRSLRAAANQPFARALREIRQAGQDSAAAWLALHRAFDRTAGRALQTSTLPVLFKQAPHLETQRGAIEQFFSQSNLRFFGVAETRTGAAGAGASRDAAVGAAVPPTGAPVELRTLATTLRRIEKQHER